ncbi:hypothetical protein GVAV_002685 [Gurleya vavrai]
MICFFSFIKFLLSDVTNEFYYSGNIIEALVEPIKNKLTEEKKLVDQKQNNFCMLLKFTNNAIASNRKILNTIFSRDINEYLQSKFQLNFVPHSNLENKQCSLNELESFLAQCKSENFLYQKHEIIAMDYEFKDVSQIYEDIENLKLGLLHTEDIKFDDFDYIDFINNLNLHNSNEEIFKSLLCIILPFDSIFLKKYVEYLKLVFKDFINKTHFKLVTWTNLIGLEILEHRQLNFEILNRKEYKENYMYSNDIYYEANSLLFNLKIKYIFPDRERIIKYFNSKGISIWRIFLIEFKSFNTLRFKFIVAVFWKQPIKLLEFDSQFLFYEHVYFIKQKTSHYKIIKNLWFLFIFQLINLA